MEKRDKGRIRNIGKERRYKKEKEEEEEEKRKEDGRKEKRTGKESRVFWKGANSHDISLDKELPLYVWQLFVFGLYVSAHNRNTLFSEEFYLSHSQFICHLCNNTHLLLIFIY